MPEGWQELKRLSQFFILLFFPQQQAEIWTLIGQLSEYTSDPCSNLLLGYILKGTSYYFCRCYWTLDYGLTDIDILDGIIFRLIIELKIKFSLNIEY